MIRPFPPTLVGPSAIGAPWLPCFFPPPSLLQVCLFHLPRLGPLGSSVGRVGLPRVLAPLGSLARAWQLMRFAAVIAKLAVPRFRHPAALGLGADLAWRFAHPLELPLPFWRPALRQARTRPFWLAIMVPSWGGFLSRFATMRFRAGVAFHGARSPGIPFQSSRP